jgi:hypothetical protein
MLVSALSVLMAWISNFRMEGDEPPGFYGPERKPNDSG